MGFNKKIKKILLIFPPVVFSSESPKQIMPPLGIAYLGACLRKNYEVRLLDAAVEGYDNEVRLDNGSYSYGLSFDKIKKRVAEFVPDVLGITCLYSSQFANVARICKDAKAVSADIITVIGGTHPTFLPEQCMREGAIDFIMLGEAEESLVRLLDAVDNGRDYSGIDGIVYRDDARGIKLNPKTSWIADVDKIPFPARDMLDLKKYFKIDLPMGLVRKKTPAMNMITSRGCPFECFFCSSCNFWGRRYRPRSVENVIAEMRQLKEMGIKEIKFFDDNLTLDKQRARELFQAMIDEKFNFSWNTPNGTAAQTLDEPMISLMKQSGCYEITLAVESGDQKILNEILKKPTDLKQIEHITKIIKGHGIDTYGFFIIGFPQETKAQIHNTLRFMEKLALDRVSLFIANPLPGTGIYQYCRENGLLTQSVDMRLDYFQSRFETAEFDRAFLEKTRRNWYWSYNLRLILRNPFKFFKKYYIFIVKKPLFLLKALFRKFLIPSLKICPK